MTERIHDNEPDMSESVVRSLLVEQQPALADLELRYLRSSGTDNAMWRVLRPDAIDLVVRLPRTPRPSKVVEAEGRILTDLASTKLVKLPVLHHSGQASDSFPFSWLILEWIEGTDAWEARDQLSPTSTDFGQDMAALVTSIRKVSGINAQARTAGQRGGPLLALLDTLDEWLTNPRWAASDLIDVAAIRRSAAESAEVADVPVKLAFTHGDLLPGNLLVEQGRLHAVIDWAQAGTADVAQDVGAAWALFEGPARHAFREALEVDDATWLRARLNELEHAVGGILYYTPRKHLLADVMRRTLDRILAE